MDTKDNTQTTLQGIDHFALFVADVDKSATWYADTLGFVKGPKRDNGLLQVRHPGGLAIVLRPCGLSGASRTEGNGLDHLAIRVSDLEELQAWSSKLLSTDSSAEIHEGRTGWTIDLRDPDDFEIELFVPKTRLAGPGSAG